MLIQPRLNVRMSQRQVMTPGLVQMVSVLALNKLELKEMINAEVVANPILEEVEESEASFDERAGREGDLERSAEQVAAEAERTEKDPFDEIDFGSYFQDYLDPGFRSGGGGSGFEDVDSPSFENFLSRAGTLTDHLTWQLGSMQIRDDVKNTVDFLIGNLDERGYLVSGWEEADAAVRDEALAVLQAFDPIGVGARDLRECLLLQINQEVLETSRALIRARAAESAAVAQMEARLEVDTEARRIVDQHLPLLQKRDMRELTKLLGCAPERLQAALDVIRALDPRPGLRYNRQETRLVEPDVAFVKRDDTWAVLMNEEDLPTLRLNAGYRKMLRQKETEREVMDYVKERYRSAIQLLRNIEQRKNTIVRCCESIVRRQQDFLELGVDSLRPMMIKEVAEEIGVHPSTVSRAVANKYVHTPQGVFELRFFFSEGVNGPEGGDLPLMLLKKKVKKLIEDEDPAHPFTDDALTAELQRQGIQVTRRTVAKYREDMNIPSTHQRRQR